jgi:hypothetical protein
LRTSLTPRISVVLAVRVDNAALVVAEAVALLSQLQMVVARARRDRRVIRAIKATKVILVYKVILVHQERQAIRGIKEIRVIRERLVRPERQGKPANLVCKAMMVSRVNPVLLV